MGQIEIGGGGNLYMLMEFGALKIGAVHNERRNEWKMRLLSLKLSYQLSFPCQHSRRACKLV